MHYRTLIVALLALRVVSANAADIYTIDPDYTRAHFEIARVGFSPQHGTFNKTHGTITLDRAAASGSVEFTVQTRSIDMGTAAWTAHLADEALLHVAKYPTMVFRSERLLFEQGVVTGAQGNFTMRGVTRPLQVRVQHFQCGLSPVDQRPLCSGTISATLRRSDFGLTRYIPVVSDEVTVQVPLDAYRTGSTSPH